MVSQKWYTLLTEISVMNLIWVRSCENLLHPLNLVLTHSESGSPIVAHQSTSTRKLSKVTYLAFSSLCLTMYFATSTQQLKTNLKDRQ